MVADIVWAVVGEGGVHGLTTSLDEMPGHGLRGCFPGTDRSRPYRWIRSAVSEGCGSPWVDRMGSMTIYLLDGPVVLRP